MHLLVGLEIFRDSSLNQKLGVFIEIADIKDKGYVSFEQIFEVLKVACLDNRGELKRYSK